MSKRIGYFSSDTQSPLFGGNVTGKIMIMPYETMKVRPNKARIFHINLNKKLVQKSHNNVWSCALLLTFTVTRCAVSSCSDSARQT